MNISKEISSEDQELIARRHTARVIRAVRKIASISQMELAKELRVSQSALSKIEAELLSPSMMFWFQFCRLFNLSADETFETGLIDHKILHTDTNEPTTGTLRLPKRYAFERGSTARSCLPFLEFFESVHGREKLKEYLKSRKLSEEHFVILDQTINIQFLLDLVSELIRDGSLNKDQLRNLTQIVSQPLYHGKLREDYDRAQDSKSLIRALVANAPKYSTNFYYLLEGEKASSIDISIKPHAHMAHFNYRPENFGSFICDYHKEYIKQFSTYRGKPSVSIDEQQCHFKGADRCVYRLNIAS